MTDDDARFLQDMYDACEEGNSRRAVGRALNYFDDLFRTGAFDRADEILSLIDPDRLGVLASIGVLAATLPVKTRCLSRDGFISRARETIRAVREPTQVDALLS